ncbi:MAG: aldo/keto reductase [Kangiellaceae bacterium]|nr:aldo/keto reductase [Kangiellaceae bacterium]
MSNYPLSKYLPNVSSIVYGCMGLGGGWNNQPYSAADVKQAATAIETAVENNINFFDHADIYTLGKAEQVFGEVLKQRPSLREQIFIQTKCGIRFEDELGPKRYDLSADWITHSVDKSLQQLHCDYLDILMLHRPDPLMDPVAIAETYQHLKQAGKVKFLGVSNMQQHQITELQRAIDTPLVANQIEMSLQQHDWLDETVYAGNKAGSEINFTAGLLEYCRENQIQIQAWGSLCQGIYSGAAASVQSPAEKQTSQLVSNLADQYKASREAIVIAWLMRHPANIQPVIGTSNSERIRSCAQATQVRLSREHWYALYVSAKGQELP